MSPVSPVDVVLETLKAIAALARALGVGDGAIHGAVLRSEEAEAVDLEVDALEEAKLEAVRARANRP